MTEVKMSRIRKRSELQKQKKTYQCTDRVSELGLVCAKMVKRVRLTRQEDEDGRVRQETVNLTRIGENETGEGEDTEDDEGAGDERDIGQTHGDGGVEGHRQRE